MSRKTNVYALILAGGQSSRLFPFNKVLSDLTGSGKSLIQQAARRAGRRETYVLTVKPMVGPIRKQLKLPKSRFFMDPVRRGTWPAILWAMAHLRRRDPAAMMAILTGDHVIQGDRGFEKSFRQAVQIAHRKPAIVMMGIPPRTDPNEWRGFGCFRTESDGRVVSFQEKPSLERAEELIRAGGWLWNSGMFFFRIATAEAALRRLQPEMYRVYAAIVSAVTAGHENRAANLYKEFPDKIPHPLDPGRMVDNSIDFAVMTPLVVQSGPDLGAYAVTDVRFRWTDLGQWTALEQVAKRDTRGNILIGDVRAGPDVHDCIIAAERGHRIEIDRVKGMIVAFAARKALVLPVSDVARVKELVAASYGKRVIGETPHRDSFSISQRKNLAILSNRRKEAI